MENVTCLCELYEYLFKEDGVLLVELQRYGGTVQTLRFPKHQEKKDQWIKALKRESWTPTEHSRLCEDHFTFGCMDRSMSYVWLHENAIPTIFPAFPSYMQQETRKRKSPMKRNPSSGVHSAESDGLLTNVVPFTTDSETTDSFNKKRNLDHSTKEGVVKKLKTTTVKYKKKIKSLQQTKRRQVKKMVSLKSVLALLRESKLINDECIETLKSIPGPNKDLFERLLKKQINESLPKKYNEELRSFALTLHYYSPAAYSYVRRVFNSCLPHPKTITSWYKAVNGEPGFTQEAFQALAARAKQRDQKLVCAMMLDEMAIRKHIEYDGKQFLGGVDMGTGLEGDNISMAKEALVFVIVCINAGWKIPVGYFLVDGVNGEQRANLVKQCLTMAHETGVRVVSLTFDGAPANFSMVRYLGCIINSYQELQTSFHHPTSGEKVYIFPDPCHMLKLVRNTLGQKKKIIDGDNNVIVWEFIEKLQKLQDFEGLHLANKLKLSHINFTKQIMKVHLAAQLFSDSIADALEICLKNLKLPDFKDCQPTIYFIRLMNKLFDIFNSKSLNHYAFKKAINSLNSEVILSFIGEAKLYIRRLKFSINGDLIIDSNRKTGFVGFLLCIESLERMYTELCVEKCLLLYVPMYKISQDHLELLLSTIRAQGGCNNNPSVRQFKSAYKKILIHTELRETSKGNCIPLEEISILHCSSSTPTCAVTIINQSTGRMRLAKEPESQNIIADHNYVPDVREVTRYSEYIISYIAGFVVRKLQNKVKCEDCVVALSSTNGDCETLSLINVKNRGGLIYPSTDVIRVCQRSEYVVKSAIAQSGGPLLLRKFSADFLTHEVLQYFLGKNIFKCLTRHSFEHSPLENHSVHLIRAIANCYITLRIHYIAKCSIDKSKNVRNLYNKLVLFKGH